MKCTFTVVSYNNSYYRFDSGRKSIENTESNPNSMLISTTTPGLTHVCTNSFKTSFNYKSCKIKESCAPIEFYDRYILLNSSTLSLFYEIGQRYVYRISGLRLDESLSPCLKISRWLISKTPCDQDTILAYNMSNEIKNIILNTETYENPYLIDIDIRHLCDSFENITGAKITIGEVL